MLHFESDYTEGCAKEILSALEKTNMESLSGYGEDFYSERAKEKILSSCGLEGKGQVFLFSGGTETNLIVISSMLRSYEGVIAARTGHVSVHEAGAIEATGHKVLELPAVNGKIKAKDLNDYLVRYHADPTMEHMVHPALVYISYPTEYGTLYSKNELTEIHNVCREYDIPLYIDGARLSYGLAGIGSDVTIKDIASLSDVFYIGGTKCGALSGEAAVFTHNNMPEHFISTQSSMAASLQRGASLACNSTRCSLITSTSGLASMRLGWRGSSSLFWRGRDMTSSSRARQTSNSSSWTTTS